MVEWSVAVEHDWRYKPGNHGRGLKRALSPEIWSEIERIFIGASLEENWRALFTTTALFRRVASTVARDLGYIYPMDLDQRMLRYLQQLRTLGR